MRSLFNIRLAVALATVLAFGAAPASIAEVPTFDDWILLGPFELAPTEGDGPTYRMELNMDRNGGLTGVVGNRRSREIHDAHGQMDRASQTAVWWISGQPQVTYSAPLRALTGDGGEVRVTSETGAQLWRMYRPIVE